MFAYCNNNPIRYLDSDGTAPEEPEWELDGFTYSVDEKFRFFWGTVTVVASYEVKMWDGCTFLLDTIEVKVTCSDIEVTMPDGISFCFEYDWTEIKPDSYTKTISEELGLKLLLNFDGLGAFMTSDTITGSWELQIQVMPSPLITAIEAVAESLPPVGGSQAGGPWDMHNKTLLFE